MDARLQKYITYLKTFDPKVKLLIGLGLIVLGLLALVTPLTPGSWLVVIGLEFIGIRIVAWESIVNWLAGRKARKTENAETEI